MPREETHAPRTCSPGKHKSSLRAVLPPAVHLGLPSHTGVWARGNSVPSRCPACGGISEMSRVALTYSGEIQNNPVVNGRGSGRQRFLHFTPLVQASPRWILISCAGILPYSEQPRKKPWTEVHEKALSGNQSGILKSGQGPCRKAGTPQ